MVAYPFFTRLYGTAENRQDPVAIGEHRNGLTDKGPRFVDQRLDVGPGIAFVQRLAIADESRILIPSFLGRIQEP